MIAATLSSCLRLVLVASLLQVSGPTVPPDVEASLATTVEAPERLALEEARRAAPWGGWYAAHRRGALDRPLHELHSARPLAGTALDVVNWELRPDGVYRSAHVEKRAMLVWVSPAGVAHALAGADDPLAGHNAMMREARLAIDARDAEFLFHLTLNLLDLRRFVVRDEAEAREMVARHAEWHLPDDEAVAALRAWSHLTRRTLRQVAPVTVRQDPPAWPVISVTMVRGGAVVLQEFRMEPCGAFERISTTELAASPFTIRDGRWRPHH